MNWRLRLKRVAVRLVTIAFVFWLVSFPAPAVVQAQGGLAISGSFHNQDFLIPQGASVSGPSIDVVVFNNGSDTLNIKMTSQAPTGVTISLSDQQLTLAPGGQQQIFVGIEVSNDVAPGDYDMSVAAQSYTEGVSGIQVAGAAGQTAKLTVTGESASVTLQALSPDGQLVVAMVRLYRIDNGRKMEMASSETGNLQATVVPDSYTAASYIGGQQVAEQSFTLAANDNKMVDLSGATVYFASFGVVPAYAKDTGKLAFVQVVYTVKNLYQQIDKGEVLLQVSSNEVSQAPLTLVTLSPLAVGSSGLNYNYTPTGGWADGSYDFQLQLNVDGKLYTGSMVQHLDVSRGMVGTAGIASPTVSGSGTTDTAVIPAPSSSGSAAGGAKGMSLYLFGGIIAAVVVVAGILIFRSDVKINRRTGD